MVTDQQVQEMVHRIEEGRWVKWVRVGALLAVLLGMFGAFVLDPWYWGLYKGLSHPKAMEQAVIARELARGHGFSTKMIRPLAYTQIKAKMGTLPTSQIPDTFQAPLWPLTLAPALAAIKVVPDAVWPFCEWPYRAPLKNRWQMTTKDYVYVCDRIVSAVAMIFFYLSLFVNYFTAKRVFDQFLGIWTVAFMAGCALFWQYSMSGLPQMLMLFLFSCSLYTLIRAIEAQNESRSPLAWLLTLSAIFGLLMLTHGLAAWTFVGVWIFCTIHFRPHRRTAILMALVALLVYSPWFIRNYIECGSPFGISLYANLTQVKGTENVIMRNLTMELSGLSPTIFRTKIQSQLAIQMGNLFASFGRIIVAPVFFLSLLHLFKNPLPKILRWALLSMWLCSMFGMALIGSDDDANLVSANDLNVLFIPMFAAYGFAFILVMWSRLEITVTLVRYAFYALIWGIGFIPLFNQLTIVNRSPVQWPPYVPPYISIMRDWTMPEEIIASDMPWAVAWYADRKSLWLPMTIQSFIDFNDYEKAGGKIAGIYLTPFSGNKSLINDIVKGDYKEWAPFILRNVNIKDFPLRAVTAMPLDNQCIFYSDRDRWTDRVD